MLLRRNPQIVLNNICWRCSLRFEEQSSRPWPPKQQERAYRIKRSSAFRLKEKDKGSLIAKRENIYKDGESLRNPTYRIRFGVGDGMKVSQAKPRNFLVPNKQNTMKKDQPVHTNVHDITSSAGDRSEASRKTIRDDILKNAAFKSRKRINLLRGYVTKQKDISEVPQSKLNDQDLPVVFSPRFDKSLRREAKFMKEHNFQKDAIFIYLLLPGAQRLLVKDYLKNREPKAPDVTDVLLITHILPKFTEVTSDRILKLRGATTSGPKFPRPQSTQTKSSGQEKQSKNKDISAPSDRPLGLIDATKSGPITHKSQSPQSKNSRHEKQSKNKNILARDVKSQSMVNKSFMASIDKSLDILKRSRSVNSMDSMVHQDQDRWQRQFSETASTVSSSSAAEQIRVSRLAESLRKHQAARLTSVQLRPSLAEIRAAAQNRSFSTSAVSQQT